MIPRLKHTTPLIIALLAVLCVDFQGQAQSAPARLANGTTEPVIFNAPPTPPSTGRPGRRSDAGSRSCGDEALSEAEITSSLLALVPTQETENTTIVFGKTAAEYPTLWFYVPYHPSLTAIFVLQDQEGNPIYESDVALPQTSGVLSVTLPATVPSLETGNPYHWFFKLYCREISPPDFFVDGWIQRELPTSDLTQQLETATSQQQVRLYATNGFWVDALTTAAELRRTNAEDSTWAELLKAIGLETTAIEAIVTP